VQLPPDPPRDPPPAIGQLTLDQYLAMMAAQGMNTTATSTVMTTPITTIVPGYVSNTTFITNTTPATFASFAANTTGITNITEPTSTMVISSTAPISALITSVPGYGSSTPSNTNATAFSTIQLMITTSASFVANATGISNITGSRSSTVINSTASMSAVITSVPSNAGSSSMLISNTTAASSTKSTMTMATSAILSMVTSPALFVSNSTGISNLNGSSTSNRAMHSTSASFNTGNGGNINNSTNASSNMNKFTTTTAAVSAPSFSTAVNVSVRVIVLGYNTATFQPAVFILSLAALLREDPLRVLIISVNPAPSARRASEAVQVQSVVAAEDSARASSALAILSSPDAAANLALQLQARGMPAAKVSDIGALLQAQDQSNVSPQNLENNGSVQMSTALIAGLGVLAGLVLLLFVVILMKNSRTQKKISSIDSSQHSETDQIQAANAEIVVVTRGNARVAGRPPPSTSEVELANLMARPDFQFLLPMHRDVAPDASIFSREHYLPTTEVATPRPEPSKDSAEVLTTWSHEHQSFLHHRTRFTVPISASAGASVEADIVYKGQA
jgi:hypothetical protein